MTELEHSTGSAAPAVTFMIDFKDFNSVTYTKQGKTTTEVPIIASLSEQMAHGKLSPNMAVNLTILVDEQAFFQRGTSVSDKQLYAQGLANWFAEWQRNPKRNGAFAAAQLQLQFFSRDGNRIRYAKAEFGADAVALEPQGKVFAFSSDAGLRAALTAGGANAVTAVPLSPLKFEASADSMAAVASAIGVRSVEPSLPQAAALAASRQQLSRPRVVAEATADPDRGLSFS